MTAIRTTLAAVALGLLAACAEPVLAPEPEPIGDFRMGFNVAVANGAVKGPLSRDATEDELATALRDAVEANLARYDGDGLYHVGLRVEAYILAQPGIPLVASPKSALILALNVWDDWTEEKLTPEPIRVIALESAPPLVSTGFTRTKEEQLASLAAAAAREVEKVLRENEAAWFGPKEGRARKPYDREAQKARLEAAQTADSGN